MNYFNTKKLKKKNRGFVALMSSIIISAIMIGFLFTTNRATFNARFDALDGEFKKISSVLAESCVHQTLLELARNFIYDPLTDASYISGIGVPIDINDGKCYIVSTTPAGTSRSGSSADVTIITTGNYKNTFSKFKAEATVQNHLSPTSTNPPPPNININSWIEIP